MDRFGYLEGKHIGAQLCVGDNLYYIERYSADNNYGYLKKIDLLTKISIEIKNLPLIRFLFDNGNEIIGIAQNYIVRIDKSSDNFSSSLIKYDYAAFSSKPSGIKIITKTNQNPEDEDRGWMRSVLFPITAVLLDEHQLWLGGGRICNPDGHSRDFSTIGGGLFKVDLTTYEWKWMLSPYESFTEETITCIRKINNYYLLGTYEGNLHFYTPQEGIYKSLTKEDGLFSTNIQFLNNFDNKVWIATGPRYLIYDLEDERAYKYDCLYTNKYFRQNFNKETQQWENDENILDHLPPHNSLTMILDQEKYTFFATFYGLYVYNKKMKVWSHFSIEEGLPDIHLSSLCYYKNILYIGTQEGLFQMEIE